MTPTEIAVYFTSWQPTERSDWYFDQVKYHYDVILGKMLQNAAQVPDDIEVPYLKAQHVQWDKVQLTDLPTMWASPQEIETLEVKQGDLIVCEGGEVGRAAIISEAPPERCIIQNALHLVRPKSTGDTRFLKYLLQHATTHAWLDVLCNRATIAHFTVEKFREMWIWLPSLAEQHAIANYLDHATAKLDALIATKQRLLDLLAEKRRALITHAVTRGLNANAPMRDSGVEWLGEIPRHWEVNRFKFYISTIEQGATPQSDTIPAQEEEWGVLKVGAVNGWNFNPNENKRLSPEAEPRHEDEIKPGDVLISRANTTELLGSAAIVRNVRPRLLISDKIYRPIFADRGLLPEYLVLFLRSVAGRYEFERDATGASNSMQNISQDSIRNVWLPVPSLQEQEGIVNYIMERTAQLDEFVNITNHTIGLLQERRIALIAAAVTGKLNLE